MQIAEVAVDTVEPAQSEFCRHRAGREVGRESPFAGTCHVIAAGHVSLDFAHLEPSVREIQSRLVNDVAVEEEILRHLLHVEESRRHAVLVPERARVFARLSCPGVFLLPPDHRSCHVLAPLSTDSIRACAPHRRPSLVQPLDECLVVVVFLLPIPEFRDAESRPVRILLKLSAVQESVALPDRLFIKIFTPVLRLSRRACLLRFHAATSSKSLYYPLVFKLMPINGH